MGFYLKSEMAGQKRMAAEFRATPKTHTPVLPLPDNGLRSYSPHMGW